MKIPIMDFGVLAKYLLPAALVAGVLLYLFIRGIVVVFWRATHTTKVQKKVVGLRQVAEPKAPPAVVRKTDLFAQLSAEQKKTYLYAKQLVEQKKIQEAAKIFESINFPRKAIDILENSGFIDEACAILLRMGVPYRAAVIYERNNQFLKASEYFLQDGKLELAARNFERQAESDFHYFRQAGDCYLQAGLVESCLKSYSRLDLSEEILRISLEQQNFEFLHRYLDLPFHAQVLLPLLTAPQIETLVQSLPLTPQGALSLALWTLYRPEEILVLASLNKLGKQKELAQVYWGRLDDNFCDYICNMLPNQTHIPAEDVLRTHIDVLFASGRPQYGELMREVQAKAIGAKGKALAIGL